MSQCQHRSSTAGGAGGGGGGDEKSHKIHDPLLRHLNPSPPISSSSSPPSFVTQAIQDLQSKGYHRLPSVLTAEECSEAIDQLWEFVRDVSGGAVLQDDPLTWYSKEEISLLDYQGSRQLVVQSSCKEAGEMSGAIKQNTDDMDPWPYTDRQANDDMMQSLGAGYLLGNIREALADRVFAPLFGTEELLCSKEGFTFSRPMIVDLEEYSNHEGDGDMDGDARYLVWSDRLNRKVDDQLHEDVGQQDDQVDISLQIAKECNNSTNNDGGNDEATAKKTSKKQYNKLQKRLNKQQRYKDISGLCHIQAAVSLTDQTIDQDRNGGHFLFSPYSHSDREKLPRMADDFEDSKTMGEKIYAKQGDVILWRSDLVHAIVAPSLTQNGDNNMKADHDSNELFGYNGSREFGAVSYCSMLPVEAVKEYNLYSVPKHKMHKKMKQHCINQVEKEMMQIKYKELVDQKLEAYRTGMTGDHRPEVENWHPHRRVTMWNAHLLGECGNINAISNGDVRLIPPRLLQRPKFRLGAQKLTIRLAELYGLLSYQHGQSSDTDTSSCDQERTRRDEIERAVSRGIRFVEGVYKDKDMCAVGPWTVKDGRFTNEWGLDKSYHFSVNRLPICLANMEVLTPCSDNGEAIGLSGQDKYLGGMASPDEIIFTAYQVMQNS